MLRNTALRDSRNNIYEYVGTVWPLWSDGCISEEGRREEAYRYKDNRVGGHENGNWPTHYGVQADKGLSRRKAGCPYRGCLRSDAFLSSCISLPSNQLSKPEKCTVRLSQTSPIPLTDKYFSEQRPSSFRKD